MAQPREVIRENSALRIEFAEWTDPTQPERLVVTVKEQVIEALDVKADAAHRTLAFLNEVISQIAEVRDELRDNMREEGVL